MMIDLNTFPQILDLLHVVLASVIVLLVLALAVARARASVAVAAAAPAAAPVRAVESESAQQLLALLQSEARLIDFFQEDIAGASDEDIGAVARTVHEGGRKVLGAYLEIAPVRSEDEETAITLPAGYDAASIRVTGNVTGSAPFTGRLVHKGWRVTSTRLPKVTDGHDVSILAPAEVEL